MTLPARVEDPVQWALKAGVPHTVLIDGRLIREMTRPVMIPWPGVTYEEAAAICGREYRSFKSWVRKCPFRIDRYREHGFPDDMAAPPRNRPRPRKCPGNHTGNDSGNHPRKGRGRRPYVWTASPIDANNSTGRVPHPVWGTLWQSQWRKLPEDYQLLVQRVPVFKKEGRRKGRCSGGDGEKTFRGWNWVCPGRMRSEGFTAELAERAEESGRSEVPPRRTGSNQKSDVDVAERAQSHPLWSALRAQHSGGGEHIPCGRRCKYLYGPQTVWTLPMAMAGGSLEDPDDGFDMPEDSGLAGQWFPGMSDTVAAAGSRVFACKRCWAVRAACFANETGWNEFISTISGGLLYGHEVERPLDVCPIVRKMPVYERPPRKPRKGFTTVRTESTEEKRSQSSEVGSQRAG